MTEVNCSTEALVEAAAHAAYEANRAYCAAIGELSGLSWADAEKWRPWASALEWQRVSIKNSVLSMMGGETPEQAHENKNRIRVAVVQAMISALRDRDRSADLPPLNAEMLQNNERAISAAAHALHEASRAYRVAIGQICHPGWQNIPDWQEANARGTVLAVIQGYTPEMAHERWRSQMELYGWSWGPEEDIDAKKHPCLARYSLLPPKHHAKSRLCVEVAHAMLSALG